MSRKVEWGEAEKARVLAMMEELTDQDAIDLCQVALYGFMKEEPHWGTVDWMGKRLRKGGARRAALALEKARSQLQAVREHLAEGQDS